MSIWDLCIRRPIFTVMLVSVPLVLGLASYGRLGVELFPNVDVPSVTITTTLRNADVEAMETTVTKPIEEIVNTVSGIDELRSTTKEGFSQVVVNFKLEKNGDAAAQEVDARVRTILSQLPEGTDAPIIDKLDVGAAPIMTLTISGKRSFREITEIARKRIKEELETISGVGAVTLVGGHRRAIQIELDPEKILKYDNLTVLEIRQAILRENQEQPGGRVDRGQLELQFRTQGRVQDPKEFAKLIIANRDGQPIRLEDVGTVKDSFEEARGLSRLWIRNGEGTNLESPGNNSVSLIIQKQSGKNTVEIADKIRQRLDQILANLPEDIEVEAIRDQSRFIRNSMEEVKSHLFLAAILVSATILLFLRDWRTTVIACLAIPTSLVGSFALMYLMGFSMNNFTMLGLILAVGIVVDDAVVVHENIFRHMEEKGLTGWEAASAATREIALAVMATTLSLVVVFAPIAFMGGQVGRFLSCFGFVVGFCVLLSMFVSFTMTPMLCSRFLKLDGGHSSKGGLFWRLIEGSYIAILGWSLRNRWAVVLLSFGVLFSTPMLMETVGKTFVIQDDQSEFEVSLLLPEGTSLQRADGMLEEIEQRLRKLPGITHTLVTIGETGRTAKGQGDVAKGTVYCRLIDLKERDYSQADVMKQARLILEDYPDIRGSVQEVAQISGAGFREVDLDLNLSGPDTRELKKISDQVIAWMKSQRCYVDVDNSLSLRKPELVMVPLKDRFSDLGVSLEAANLTTRVLVGGEPLTKYKERDEEYDVWLRGKRSARWDSTVIEQMVVPAANTPSGVTQLGNVARFKLGVGPNTIERFARQRQVVISANLDQKDLAGAVQEVSEYLKSLNLPPEYRFEFLGRAKMLAESNDNFAIGFLLAFVFMYMILAAQFESFVHPISILVALPLTIPFAIASLIVLNTDLDIFAMLGLFMLFGIVKKNGILQIDSTNHLRNQGLPRNEAILEANRVRLRPILMTTMMLVAAMIPMALGEGPGAGTRSSMAKVILGGQVLSLLLTLLVTPVAYSLFDGLGRRTRSLLFGG
jgi:HAE1 family hydrophobic/amphiphilic exporter-1